MKKPWYDVYVVRKASALKGYQQQSNIMDEKWYHTIKLPGDRVTRGIYDMQPYMDKYFTPSMEGMTVLDVGCADGAMSLEAFKRGAKKVTSVDANPDVLRHAKYVLSQWKYDHDIVEADIFGTEFNNLAQHDIVICSFVLCHIAAMRTESLSPTLAINIMKEKVSTDGKLIIVDSADYTSALSKLFNTTEKTTFELAAVGNITVSIGKL